MFLAGLLFNHLGSKSCALITNIDILKKISTQKKHRPKYVVGFSAETDGKILAKKKLKEKNCDNE